MPIRRKRKFTSWSYSRLTEWEACPFRAAKKHLEKVKEPEGPALARGKLIEAEVYDFVFKKGKTVPKSGALFKEELTKLQKIARAVLNNRDLAFDRDWKPCAWDDWDRAWVRIRMDLLWAASLEDPFKLPTKATKGVGIYVSDLKSGRIYEDKLDQLDLYKATALLLEPGFLSNLELDVALSQMWYLDQGETRPAGSWDSLTRAELPKALKKWEKRVTPMLLDEAFVPKPGFHCKYCHLAKTKGGSCPY